MSGQVIPFRRPPKTLEDDSALGELLRVRDQAEALVVRGLLEAHGVRAVLRTRLAPSVHPFTVGDQGEVRILVPRDALDECRRLLARAASSSSPS